MVWSQEWLIWKIEKNHKWVGATSVSALLKNRIVGATSVSALLKNRMVGATSVSALLKIE